MISFSTINNEETFLQDFVVILKRMLQNYNKILMKRFLKNHVDCDVIKRFKYVITHWCVTRRERVNILKS